MPLKFPAPIFLTPGRHKYPNNNNALMLSWGKKLRDEELYKYPLLPGALAVYSEMVASREWKVSGKPRAVSRCVEKLNNAVTYNYDGTVDKGFDQFIQRLANDYNPIGRIVFWLKEGGELQYLDPTELFYNREERTWYTTIDESKYPANELYFYHPVPVGSSGQFMAPLLPVIPTAQLAWLIREHDTAAADGRKIRDIKIVIGKDIKDNIEDALNTSAALWAGEDPQKHGIPIIAVEDPANGLTAADLVASLGLANIPADMDRKNFQFVYANEIANHIGLAVRNFWNMEMGTNRALEDVQEARQVNKGPAFFVRTIQRMLRGPIKQFGSDTRMGFIEEIDSASRKVDAEVVSTYMDGVKKLIEALMLAQQGQGRVLVKPIVGWLQSINLLPPDVDIIDEDFVNELVSSEQNPIPQNGSVMESSDPQPTPNEPSKETDLDYGEISMTLSGTVLDRRLRIFTIEKILEKQIAEDAAWKQETLDQHTPPKFIDALKKSRDKNLGIFKDYTFEDQEDIEMQKSILGKEDLTDEDHRDIKDLLKKTSKINSYFEKKTEIVH